MRIRRQNLLAILVLLASGAMFSQVVAGSCSDCTTDAQGRKNSPTGCCCSCSQGGINPCSAEVTCQDNQKASCSCNGDTGASITSCTSNTNQGVKSDSEFYQITISNGNIVNLGAHIKKMDANWNVNVAGGFNGGTPASHTYNWPSGTDLSTALNQVGADYGACVQVDYTNTTLTINPAGGC